MRKSDICLNQSYLCDNEPTCTDSYYYIASIDEINAFCVDKCPAGLAVERNECKSVCSGSFIMNYD